MSALRWQDEPKIRAWLDRIRAEGCTVRALEALDLLYKPSGALLFAFVKSDVTTPDGTPLPSYCFIRGDACIVVPLIRNRDTGTERFLMVRLRRVGSGSLSLEFPAGMLDNAIDDPVGVAVREMEEETGITVTPGELRPLIPGPLFSSAGACDERIYYYGCLLTLSDAECRSLEGRRTGSENESEYISVTLKTELEARTEISSLQAHLGFFLFRNRFEPERARE